MSARSISSSGGSADAVVGPITALGSDTITLAGSVTCRFEQGSPDVSGYRPGDRVAAGCENGVLTQLKHA